MYAFAPTGSPIVGTLEIVTGCSGVQTSSYDRDHSGKLVFDYDGDTDVYWDEIETVTRKGERVFIDEDGESWTESQIVLSPDEDYAPEPRTS